MEIWKREKFYFRTDRRRSFGVIPPQNIPLLGLGRLKKGKIDGESGEEMENRDRGRSKKR